MTTNYVLYIELGDDPPRVAVFDTPEEAVANLGYFEVVHFDPPQNDELLYKVFRSRIFECKDTSYDNWGTEVDINAFRKKQEDDLIASGLPPWASTAEISAALAAKNVDI